MKPRSDSVLLNLSPDQQDLIASWLLDGVETDDGRDTSYKAVKAKIWLDLSVKTSEASLCDFYRKVCAPRRLRIAVAARDGFVEGLEAKGVNFTTANRQLAEQQIFEMLAVGDIQPRALDSLNNIVASIDKGAFKTKDQEQKDRALDQKDEQIQMLKDEKAAAKAALSAVTSKGGLSPETLAEIERAAALL